MHMYKSFAHRIIDLANGLTDNEILELHIRGNASDGVNPIGITKGFQSIKQIGLHRIEIINNRGHAKIIDLRDISLAEVWYINNPYKHPNPVGF